MQALTSSDNCSEIHIFHSPVSSPSECGLKWDPPFVAAIDQHKARVICKKCLATYNAKMLLKTYRSLAVVEELLSMTNDDDRACTELENSLRELRKTFSTLIIAVNRDINEGRDNFIELTKVHLYDGDK